MDLRYQVAQAQHSQVVEVSVTYFRIDVPLSPPDPSLPPSLCSYVCWHHHEAMNPIPCTQCSMLMHHSPPPPLSINRSSLPPSSSSSSETRASSPPPSLSRRALPLFQISRSCQPSLLAPPQGIRPSIILEINQLINIFIFLLVSVPTFPRLPEYIPSQAAPAACLGLFVNEIF